MPLVLMVYFKIGISITNTNMPTVICNISSYIHMCCPIYCIIVYIKRLCKLVSINKSFSEEIPKNLKNTYMCI